MSEEHRPERESLSCSQAELEALLLKYIPSIQAFIRLNAGPTIRVRETSLDLLQSALREVIRDLPQFEFRGESAFRNWLFTHALHKIQEKHRFYHRQQRDLRRDVRISDIGEVSPAAIACYSRWDSPSAETRLRETAATIEEAFSALPGSQRQAVALYRIAKLSYKEIAAEMQKTEKAVRDLVYRGLAKLAVELDRLF